METSIGLTGEQVYGDLYHAWLKDTGKKNTDDSMKLFREVMERGFRDKQITLRKERLGANVAASLAALLHRTPLNRLDLHGNTLRDSGCETIAYLIRDMPNLTYLDLGANDIGPLGIQTLSYVLGGHKKLQTVILGSSKHDAYANRINASSAVILLEGCLRSRTLRHLDLSGSVIGQCQGRMRDFSLMAGTSSSGASFQGGALSKGAFQPTSPGSRKNAPAVSKSGYTAASFGGGGSTGAALSSGATGEDHNGLKSSGERHHRPVDVLAELISTSTTLTTLKLREVMLSTPEALRLIRAATESCSLAYIDLTGNSLTRSVGDAFGDLVRARTLMQSPSVLHTILLNDNPLMRPNAGMPAPRLFSALSSDHVVVKLHLDSCGIDDAAIEPLCEALLGSTSVLQSLHLMNNAITSRGASLLSSVLVRHTRLQDVSLEGNVIKDEGICSLARMLEVNCTLLSLNIARTWMGERGIIALGVSLVKNRKLQRLKIDHNHFTDESCESFTALLESNRSLQCCSLNGNSVGYHTVLRAEKITARNLEEFRNMERVELEKDVIHLHYQIYKVDEARVELENLRQRKAEVGRALDAFEIQHKQETGDVAKRLQDLQEMLDTCVEKENHCLSEKQRLDDELHQAYKRAEVDMELLKERLVVEAVQREKAEEDLRALKAQLEDMMNNGAGREEAKRKQLQDVNEDQRRWSAQRKEYRNAISEAAAAVAELEERIKEDSKKEGPKKSSKKGKGSKKK